MPTSLHIGVGNFFRAHQAWYLHKIGDWDVVGVSLRSPDIRDRLSAQDFRYHLVIDGTGGRQIERIECLSNILVAPEDPSAVLKKIRDPQISLITVTVTEKGYHLRPDGHLDLDDPTIRDDLHNKLPKSLIGFLAHGLSERDAPITVLSCDNRTSNGDVLGRAVEAFADRAGLRPPNRQASFPNSMVDRITPATDPGLIGELEERGVTDASPVPTEDFSDWVIEHSFQGLQPDWKSAGVTVVDDVSPFELRKLRLLNGAHSYLAYAGTLAGHTYVHEAIADPEMRAGAIGVMTEATQTLPDAVRSSAPDYALALIKRFENPGLRHALRQIAMDGSEKVQYRLLDSLAARRDTPSPFLRAAVEAWINFCISECQNGRALQDPRAKEIASACASDAPRVRLAELIRYGVK
ncbi:MAG: mannitol dehydrogenase family protein [Pseudomonadota bacterium]